MTQADLPGVPSRGIETLAPESWSGDLFRFLRGGHVLGALLREVFEEKLLGDLDLHSLTRLQFWTLKLIALNGGLKVGEVARCVGVSPSACTKNVDKLERLGLVSRVPSPRDRRATLLEANETGLEVVRRYELMKTAQVGPVVRALGQCKAEQLCDLLDEVCFGLLEIEHRSLGPCLRCSGFFHADCSIGRAQGACALRMGSKRHSSGSASGKRRETGSGRSVR